MQHLGSLRPTGTAVLPYQVDETPGEKKGAHDPSPQTPPRIFDKYDGSEGNGDGGLPHIRPRLVTVQTRFAWA